jgi:hypothetical protein
MQLSESFSGRPRRGNFCQPSFGSFLLFQSEKALKKQVAKRKHIDKLVCRETARIMKGKLDVGKINIGKEEEEEEEEEEEAEEVVEEKKEKKEKKEEATPGTKRATCPLLRPHGLMPSMAARPCFLWLFTPLLVRRCTAHSSDTLQQQTIYDNHNCSV